MKNPVQVGAKYNFTEDFTFTQAGQVVASFNAGDILVVLAETLEDPYGHKRKGLGFPNYKVEGRNGVTIWTTLPTLIEIGVLELIDERIN